MHPRSLRPELISGQTNSGGLAHRGRIVALVLVAAATGACGEESQPAKDVAATVDDSVVLADTNGAGDDVAAGVDTGAVGGDGAAGSGDVAGGDGFPDITWPGDGTCQADCVGKVCGPDGCGSVCGYCLSGQFCAEDGSECTTFCKKQCDGKKCGPDGCGGKCGLCQDKFHCGQDSLCHADGCVPVCEGIVCGDDGCGKDCGKCATGDVCAEGECKPGPCKDIPSQGKCVGTLLESCAGSGISAEKQVFDCASKAGKVCGWDPVAGANGCIDKPPCKPVCTNADGKKLECGDDSCEGSCGTCPSGWACPTGFCTPAAGADCAGLVTPQGKCAGDLWIFCNSGKVSMIDCAAYAKKCVWSANKFVCE